MGLSKVVFFLTDPKISKCAITQWFLGSLYRALWIFWCFLIKSICCTIQGLSTQIHPQKHQSLTYIHIMFKTALRYPFEKLLRHPPHISRQHETLTDTKRHQQVPFDVNLNGHTSSNSLFGCLGRSVGVAGCQFVSVVVLNRPKITGGGFWEHNNGAYVCLWGLNASEGVY